MWCQRAGIIDRHVFGQPCRLLNGSTGPVETIRLNELSEKTKKDPDFLVGLSKYTNARLRSGSGSVALALPSPCRVRPLAYGNDCRVFVVIDVRDEPDVVPDATRAGHVRLFSDSDADRHGTERPRAADDGS